MKKSLLKTSWLMKPVLVLFILFAPKFIQAQTVYNFTTAGAVGRTGPTQAQLNTAYPIGNTLNGAVTSNAGIQTWTVALTGKYKIEAAGAKGGAATGGNGASLQGTFNLTAGQVLKIAIGQMGINSTNGLRSGGGGGGGTFVTLSDNTPLIIAGGGGGGTYNSNGLPGLTTTAGGSVYQNGGGINGNGGQNGISDGEAGGGGGLLTPGQNGLNGTLYSPGGMAFIDGALGGLAGNMGIYNGGDGGFGGGAAGWNNTYTRSGGGGGYSGGQGGGYSYNPPAIAGGGGSFNSGTSMVNTSGANATAGYLTITNLFSVAINQTALASCMGNTAALSSTVAGGTGPYTYAWSPSGGNASTATDLAAGTYTLTVTDANLDQISNTFTIAQPIPAAAPTITNQLVCVGATTTAVTFSGPTIGTICDTRNESDDLLIYTAPAGAVFTSVVFASYGDPTGTCGNFAINPACHAASSASIFNAAIGQNSFSIRANNTTFTDPCFGTGKHLSFELGYGPSYTWTNSNPSIGLPASGVGSIPAFTATNTSNTVQTATITITSTSGSCAGQTSTFTISVNPPVSITTAATLPQATVATAYSTTIVAAGGSPTPNYTYAVTSGALPSGITLSSAGVLSGATTSAAGDYIFDVTATESACSNTGTKSFTLTLAKGTQTFTFAALPAKIYGEADFAAGATINTGNAITYTSSNTAVATIVSGNMIHIVGAGTADITASQAGDPSYNAATSTQSLTVNAAPLTVTATGPAKAFGEVLTAGTSTTNFTSSTAVGTEQVTGVTLTPDAAGASATTAAGSAYVVTPSAATGANGFSANNYNITYAPFNGIVGQTAQTISFNPLANATYGAAPIALTATSSSGLPVSYSSSNTAVATVSGNTLTVVGAGTTIITASQNNNTNFTPAVPVDQSFTVDPKAITVTANTRTKVYGVADPALTYTNTPLVGTDVFTGALSRAAGENIGTYAIGQNTLALSSNYTLTYVGADLTITAKPVTVTATAGQTKVYGTADAVFAYTINTPLIAGDAFTGALTRAAGENIGTAYAINQGNLALSSNYALSYTGANFSITAKPITAIADAKTKEYGSADPALTFSTDVPLIGTDAFTGNISRTAGENAGSYAINKNTLALSSNYTLSYTTANLTISKKALTITADNKVKFQGTANPALTASYAGFIAGENNTNLTAQPALSTTATNASVAGSYPITVSAASSNNYAITFVPGTLTVTSGIPTSLSLAPATLYENRAAGTTAGSLSSTSQDPGATFTYTLVTGAGSADNGSFSISGNQLLTAQSFDFETKNAYNIRVRTTTQYGLSLEQTFTVNVSDVNEVPTLTAIADQAICYVTGTQNVAITGITAGPETAQSTTISVSSNNPNLFATLSVSKTGTAGTLSYSAKTGASGTATVTVTVQDNGGTANSGTDTFTRTFTITIFALPTPSITSNKGNSVGKGETIQLTATGGTSYVWAANSSILSGQNTAILTVRPSVTTTYTVTATNANGCSESTSFTIAVESDYSKLKSTNILTPNNDGFNDKWVITNIDLYGNNEAKVFDKAGRLVYSKKNYDNSWDGTFNGAPLSEDTYYYIVDFGPGKGRLKGFITIIREQ